MARSKFVKLPLLAWLAWLASLALPASGCTQPEGAAEDAEGEASGESESDESGGLAATYTYWRDAKSVIDSKCAGCHEPGDIAPFPLTSHAEVSAVAAILPSAIESGSMPPWPPSDACNVYRHDRSLDEAEQELLLTWLAEGAPEGDPADEPASDPGDETDAFVPDLTLAIPEPYTPTKEPDDYRCFVIPWEQAGYVTGFRVEPDQRSIVHHVIAFAVEPGQADTVEAMDAADEGPGYTCFGGAGVQSRWVASWAPGGLGTVFPDGTGVRIDPGSRLVVQLHYNTASADPVADQTALSFMLAESVERPLVNQPLTNPAWPTGLDPMTIPAGDPDVTHAVEIALDSPLWAAQIAETGVQAGEDVLLHAAGLHMHNLGVRARMSIVRAGGADDCVVEIPSWDFGWQGGYELIEPLRISAGDQISLQCWWDNSAENQPILDGELAEPIDVEWGEGTRDEMCLGILMLTRP
ncbi:monooxygenase [Nannocystaceae bacterium ST9]